MWAYTAPVGCALAFNYSENMYYYIIYVCSISEIDPCELSYKRLV